VKAEPARVWEPNPAPLCKQRGQPSEYFVNDIMRYVYKTLFDQAVRCEIIRLAKQFVFPLWVIYNEHYTDGF
jgi:hypothetical protein